MKEYREIVIEGVHVGSSECGPHRDYELSTEGSTLEECIENAFIVAIDQDGGERGLYKMENYSARLYDLCVEIIKEELEKTTVELTKHDRSQDY